MFIENPYQWGVSYDYALPLSENTLLHIHSHGAIHTYKLMRMYFISCEQYFRGSVAPALDGKRMAIQLLSHEGAYKTDGSGNKSVTSSDTWIFVDDIKIVRTTSR